MGIVQFGEKAPQGDPSPTWRVQPGEGWALLPESKRQVKGKQPQVATGEVQVGYWEKFLP